MWNIISVNILSVPFPLSYLLGFPLGSVVKKLPAMQVDFPGGANDKEPACQSEDTRDSGFNPWVGKIPWRSIWQPTSVFLLENPKDRGAWWAIIHGVAKNRLQLKQLSTHASTLCSQMGPTEPFQPPRRLQVWSDIHWQPRSLQKYIKGRI